MFDKTITIYNKRTGSTPKETVWHKTVIEGASWSGHQRVSIGEGLFSNDGYSVRIPVGNMPEGFLKRDEVVDETAEYWTAQNGDVVMLGVGPNVEKGITEITKRFTDCFVVTAVNTANMARLLPHLRMEGQ